jgi:hypothetical protein
MRTPRLPAFDWTDAPADLNGLVRFTERQNLVSARVPSHFKRNLQLETKGTTMQATHKHWNKFTLSWASNDSFYRKTQSQKSNDTSTTASFQCASAVFTWYSILFVYFTFEFFSTVRFLFPPVLLLSFRCVISFCCRPTWYPAGIRFSRDSMMLTCWFVSNLLPPCVWAITRRPGSSSIHSHARRYSQRRNFHPSAAISHIRFQFLTVSYTSENSSR